MRKRKSQSKDTAKRSDNESKTSWLYLKWETRKRYPIDYPTKKCYTRVMKHYVYQLTTQAPNGSELYYIGVRSSSTEPELDTTYMSSSKLVDHMRGQGIEFTKRILDVYPSRDLANQAEQTLLEMLNAAVDNTYINLHAITKPYEAGRAAEKIQYFKTLFPKLEPVYGTPKTRDLQHWETRYRIGQCPWAYKFIGHPERLKWYWHTTGTRSYWPGRSDGLMTQTKKHCLYYKTDLTQLDGTPLERIQELYLNHYVEGQRTPVLELIEELMTMLKLDDWLVARALVEQSSSSKTWILRRIDKSKPKAKKQITIKRIL